MEEPQAEGTMRLPLVSGPAPDGTRYRLVGATFNIVGPQTVTITDTSADTVQTTLQAGDYTVELAGSWQMERVDAPGTPVQVQMLSPNPLPLFITKDETTQLRFLFKYPGDGTAELDIGVDDGGWLAGTIHFTELADPNGTPTPFSELVGKSVPFLISFPTSTATKSTWSKSLHVATAPVTFQFGGSPSTLLQRAAADLSGVSINFDLMERSNGLIEFSDMHMSGTSGEFHLYVSRSDPFPGQFDDEGYPARRPFEFDTTVQLYGGGNGVWGTVTVNGSP